MPKAKTQPRPPKRQAIEDRLIQSGWLRYQVSSQAELDGICAYDPHRPKGRPWIVRIFDPREPIDVRKWLQPRITDGMDGAVPNWWLIVEGCDRPVHPAWVLV